MSVSIVFPTLIRSNDQFTTTIKSINLARENTKIPFELVIVETETNYLEEFADRYIYFPEKTISTEDINAGFKAARSEFVGLLTNDVFVGPDWLDCLLGCFSNKDCGIATLASTQFNDVLQVGRIDFGIWCSVFLTKKEYFEKFGYFNAEEFPNVWDDTDYIMRLSLNGLKPYKNYGSVAHHKVGMTQYADPRHEKQYAENRERFNTKYKDCNDPLFELLR